MMLKGVHFKPWIPEGDPRFRGLKLLLLGESHYDPSKSGHFGLADAVGTTTQWCVREHGIEGEKRTRFFANVYSTVTGEPWIAKSDQLGRFWNSVVFYNYVQEFVGLTWRMRPTAAMWKRSHEGFRSVLDDVRPDAVLVLGKTLWKNMDEAGAERSSIADEPLAPLYTYRIEEKAILVGHISHPSSHGFSAVKWRADVRDFLDLAGAA